jgi:hypothetical protein
MLETRRPGSRSLPVCGLHGAELNLASQPRRRAPTNVPGTNAPRVFLIRSQPSTAGMSARMPRFRRHALIVPALPVRQLPDPLRHLQLLRPRQHLLHRRLRPNSPAPGGDRGRPALPGIEDWQTEPRRTHPPLSRATKNSDASWFTRCGGRCSPPGSDDGDRGDGRFACRTGAGFNRAL